jgi:hypothetical protein
LYSKEEEALVLTVVEMGNDNRAAYGTAELVAFERIHRLFAVDVAEVVGGVELTIADEPKGAAVERVGAALGDDVDHAAAVLAVLGVVVAGLYAELLKGIGHGERSVDIGVLINVIAAV